jgi:hypothetical protein
VNWFSSIPDKYRKEILDRVKIKSEKNKSNKQVNDYQVILNIASANTMNKKRELSQEDLHQTEGTAGLPRTLVNSTSALLTSLPQHDKNPNEADKISTSINILIIHI